MINIGFISLGCSKNLVDSEKIIALFPKTHFNIISDPKMCDVVIINTCGFILPAKKEAIDTILEFIEYKKNNLKKIIVTGCFVQRYLDELKKEFKDEVDLFVAIKDYNKLPKLLSKLFNIEFKTQYGRNRLLTTNSSTAYLRISDGCDNRCTYCAIPLIRGNCKSEKISDLVKQAKHLKSIGIEELTIIAQDTTYYGHDLYGKYMLKDLLKKLDKIGFKWIRILYMYPDEIDEELILTIKNSKTILPYFDIPIQYGNTKILKLMHRRGSVTTIKKVISLIRKHFKDPIIRTTIIVGFPYETDKTFDDTLQLIKELKFDSLGAFIYSDEEDTIAYDYDCKVDKKLAQTRYKKIMQAQKQIVKEKNKNRINTKIDVLVENYDEINNVYIARGFMSAPDDVDGYVYIKTDKKLIIGEFYCVDIKKCKEYDLYATY